MVSSMKNELIVPKSTEIWQLKSKLDESKKSHVTVGELKKGLSRIPKKLSIAVIEELTKKSINELKDSDVIIF